MRIFGHIFTFINFNSVFNLFIFQVFPPLPHCSLLQFLINAISVFRLRREHVVINQPVIEFEQSTVTAVVVFHCLIDCLILPLGWKLECIDLRDVELRVVFGFQFVDAFNVIFAF